MKWIVESPTHLRQLPEMDKPRFNHVDCIGCRYEWNAYNKALASMPTIIRGDKNTWSIGDVLDEGVDFEVRNRYGIPPGGFVAIPVAQPEKEESEDEIWNSAVAIIAAADICKTTNPGDNDGINNWKEKTIKKLKQQFSIKRR